MEPYNSTYFVKNDTTSKTFYTEKDNISMLDFLIDNIFVEFGGQIFLQCTGLPQELISRLCLLICFCTHMKQNLGYPELGQTEEGLCS